MPSEPAPFLGCSLHSSACERALLSWHPQELRAAPRADQLPSVQPCCHIICDSSLDPVTTCTLKTANLLSAYTAQGCRDGSLWPMLLCQAAAAEAQGSAVCQLASPSPASAEEQQMPGHGVGSPLLFTREAW